MRKKQEKPWTRKEEQRLTLDYGSMSNAELGRVYGRTRWSIQGKAKSLGIGKHYSLWNSDDDARLIRLHRNGWTDDDISIRMNRCLDTIRRHRKKLGLAGHPPNSLRRRAKISIGKRRYERERRIKQCPGSVKSSGSKNSAVRSHRCEPAEAD